MLDLKKLFARDAAGKGTPPDLDSDYDATQGDGVGLEVEYQSLIARLFRRAGISPDCTTIEVRKSATAPDGRDVLVAMVRLAAWDRESALRLLLGLPLLEAKVRKTVRASWLADFSHFGGLWLHPSESIQHSPGPAQLRDLLLALVPPTSVTSDSGPQPLASEDAPPAAGGRSAR